MQGLRRLRFDSWLEKSPWSRKWQLTLGFLPGESHGQRSLGSYSIQDCKEVGWLKWLSIHTYATHIPRWLPMPTYSINISMSYVSTNVYSINIYKYKLIFYILYNTCNILYIIKYNIYSIYYKYIIYIIYRYTYIFFSN